MKKILYLVAIIIAIAGLVFSSIQLVNAVGGQTLTYNGKSKTFTYAGVDQGDFFDDFKDLIPGDSRSQTITIQAVQLPQPATMYLRLDNIAVHEDIYQYIDLIIAKDGTTIFDSASDANETLIKLHEFPGDDSFELSINISVPVEVGNEISDLTKTLEWTFYIEEPTPEPEPEPQPEPSDDDDSGQSKPSEDKTPLPRTFDNSQIYLNLAVFTVSLIALIILSSRIYRLFKQSN